LETSLSSQFTALLLTTENKETEQHLHLKHNENKHKKLVLAKTNIKLQNPGLVAFCDMRPGNGAHLGKSLLG